MQPYFFPYAGYFRLLAAADEFVIFDCVQFPRRGRVHRTEVPGADGSQWLTLPLASAPRDVRIDDLAFAPDAMERFEARLARHSWIEAAGGPAAGRVRRFLHAPKDSVVDYLEEGLALVADVVGLKTTLRRSSTLALDPALRGQDRVIAAAQAVGATAYVNPPGGRDLYEPEAFRRVGIELSFLVPYEGRFFQLLPALMNEEPAEIHADVLAQTRLV